MRVFLTGTNGIKYTFMTEKVVMCAEVVPGRETFIILEGGDDNYFIVSMPLEDVAALLDGGGK